MLFGGSAMLGNLYWFASPDSLGGLSGFNISNQSDLGIDRLSNQLEIMNKFFNTCIVGIICDWLQS